MASKLDNYLILSGFFGPIIFGMVIMAAALMFPGYDHLNQYISELGAVGSPVQALMNVLGFNLLGALVMLFSIGLFRSSELHSAGKVASAFFFLTGALMFLVGVFPCDPLCRNTTQTGELHNLTSNYQFAVMAAGLLSFAFDALGNKKLRMLAPVILIIGSITLILAYISLASLMPPPYPGGVQRLAIGLPYALMALIAARLYKTQANASMRKLSLVLGVVFAIVLLISVSRQLEVNSTGGPGLAGLCLNEEDCNEFCRDNLARCKQYCNTNPGNPLCQKPFPFEAAG